MVLTASDAEIAACDLQGRAARGRRDPESLAVDEDDRADLLLNFDQSLACLLLDQPEHCRTESVLRADNRGKPPIDESVRPTEGAALMGGGLQASEVQPAVPRAAAELGSELATGHGHRPRPHRHDGFGSHHEKVGDGRGGVVEPARAASPFRRACPPPFAPTRDPSAATRPSHAGPSGGLPCEWRKARSHEAAATRSETGRSGRRR
jgi:hypothetical protein